MSLKGAAGATRRQRILADSRKAASCWAQIASQAMIALRLYLENIAGDWFGWIEEYPGAYAQGATQDEAQLSAAHAFTRYLSWLSSHGEPVSDALRYSTSADFEVRTADVQQDTAEGPWALKHLMPGDADLLRAEGLERHLRLLRWTREDLGSAVHAIPPHEWDTAPFGEPSIRALLQKMGQAESAMLARAGIDPIVRQHADPWVNLSRARSAFESSVRDAFERETERPATERADRWYLARVLRLAVWNERICTHRIAMRSNPAAYLRSVARVEAVVRQPAYNDRSPSDAVPEGAETACHIQNSGYYY